MAYRFRASEQGEKLLEEAGLAQRIRDTKNLDITGYWYEDSVHGALEDMEERGYVSQSEEAQAVTRTNLAALLNALIENNADKKPTWTVERPDGTTVREKLEMEHFKILSGYNASLVLSPTEYNRNADYGFESHADFVGTIGAYVQQTRRRLKEGYVWQSDYKDQRYETQITGSDHLDPEINRINISSMKAIDPMGHPISYRPMVEGDFSGLYPGHSSEPSILGALLRHAWQQNIDCKTLANKGRDFLKEVRTWKENLGAEYDSLYLNTVMEDLLHRPLANPETKRTLFWCLGTPNGHASYAFHHDADDNLAVSLMQPKVYAIEKTPAIVFPPHDIDHLIRGLFVASVKNLGRTCPQKLIDVLEARFAEKFEKELEGTR